MIDSNRHHGGRGSRGDKNGSRSSEQGQWRQLYSKSSNLHETCLTYCNIEPSRSAYSSPVLILEEKIKQWRLCIDYRQLNMHLERDAYPVPRSEVH